MANNRMAQQVVNFQRQSFENWYNAVTLLQDQATSAMDMMMDQIAWVPDEGRQSIQEWVSIFQHERNRFKSLMHEGFNHYEKYISESMKEAGKTASGMAGQVEKGMEKAEKRFEKPERPMEKSPEKQK